jgi:[acyl-carrier-protein] S-malonyltransferase
MSVAFLFPGQGAQAVGMGKDLYEWSDAAREVFDRCEAAAQLPLRRLCFDGPDPELARTDVCQPAIFAVSAATLAAMKEHLGAAMPTPAVMAGLSLGEYTALYAATAMDLETSIKLVAQRGALMQEAAATVPSGMVSVLGLDEAAAGALCKAASDGQILTCANFNCPGQIVLSGQIDACKRAADMAAEFGASAAVPLNVAGAFHSEIMAPAAEKLRSALAEAAIRRPQVPVIANVDAGPHGDPDEVRRKLLAQLVCPVRWQQSMERLLSDGAETFYEIGPGRVLTGLMRRIHRRAEVTSVGAAGAVRSLALQP